MHVSRRADDFVRAELFAEAVAQPALHQVDGEIGDVDTNPAALELLCDGNSRSATAEGIEHYVPFVTSLPL